MRLRMAALAGLAASTACVLPGHLLVAYDRDAWTLEQRLAIERGIEMAGSFASPLGAPAEVSIVRRDDHDPATAHLLGRYTPIWGTIEVWAEHVGTNPDRLSSTVAHEVGHALGAQHVCAYPGELPDATHPHEQCSPVGYGPAVMNPYDSGWVVLTPLDLAEIRRHQGAAWSPR